MPQRGADGAPGGVDAGDQQQPERAQHMLIRQWLAIPVTRIHQGRNQIVARMLLAMLDVAGKVGRHLMHGRHQRVVVLDAELEDTVDPFDEEIAVLLGNSEHVRDGAHRNVLGVPRGRVAFAVGDEFVDQLVADRAHPRLQLLHRVGRERRQQQLLGRLVLGRIGGDRRRPGRDLRPDVAHDDAAGGKMLGIVGDFLHRLVGGRHVAAEKAFGVNDRRGRAQFFPDRKRVFRPDRIGVIEIVDPVGDRGMFGHDAGGIGHRSDFPFCSFGQIQTIK
jgi:hypothetical protein